MTARDMVQTLLAGRSGAPARDHAEATAPANIALVKYWGKRDAELNLPVTDSLSVALTPLGTQTRLAPRRGGDEVTLNGAAVPPDDPFAVRLARFLDLFRPAPDVGFAVATVNTVPTAAGIASSASGFAALTRALDALFDWRLPPAALSALARLGSGSACRSLWDGFVEWRAGERADGRDSHGVPLSETWPGLCVGLRIVDAGPKSAPSRAAMNDTTASSPLYAAWPDTVRRDLAAARAAIARRDFAALGATAEGNALAMHATALAARPAVCYWQPETLRTLRRVWALRAAGTPVYATLDAGPNVKLLFEAPARSAVRVAFPDLQVIGPFDRAP